MMIIPIAIALLVAGAFAGVAYLGIELSNAVCKNIVPFEDGPRPAKSPVMALIVGTAFVGFMVSLQNQDPMQIGLVAILCISLVACWHSDVICGVIPDFFTLVPLGAVLLAACLQHQWWLVASAAVPAIAFGGAALLSKGKGMGWGDVKLSALGGAVLGMGPAVLAFALACIVAVVVAWLRGRKAEPIAFAPYLSGAIAFFIVAPIAR